MKYHQGSKAEQRSIPLMTRDAGVASINPAKRTFEVRWTTGAPVTRRDPFTDETYVEELEVSATAIRMGRLNSGAAPFMSEHYRSMGVVERAWLNGSEGRALIRFPKLGIDPEADRVFALIEDKIRQNVSVGYRVHKFEKSRDAQNRLLYRAVDWEPYEISTVAIGADPNARVRSDNTYACTFINRETLSGSNIAQIRMRLRGELLSLAHETGAGAARTRMLLRSELVKLR